MIQRKVFQILEKELKKNKITVITGARQVGKSTAMEYIFNKVKDANFITFDNSAIKNLFESNIDLFIDEFQYAKQGGKNLKYLYDKTKKKFFISGSSKPEIAIQSLQYLVGRVSLIEMHPLSFEEFVLYKSPEKKILLHKKRKIQDLEQLKSEFEEFLMFGGYPDVVKEKNFEEKKKILKDIVQVYLLKEIKDVLGYKDSYEFEKLLKTLAVNNGKLSKYTNLSNLLDLSWNKVQEYVSVLNKTNVIISVQPFYSNKAKEIIKTPKIYFNDIGFLNALLNNFSRIEERVDKGEILESFVLHELQKNDLMPKFWNKQLAEVDFVLEKDNKIIAIECKSNEKKIPRSLRSFTSEYNIFKSVIFNLKSDKKSNELKSPIEFTHYINVSSYDYFN